MEHKMSNSDLTLHVRRILIEEAAPALGLETSGLEVVEVVDGIARVRMGSVCTGCPSTLMMVIHGLESELRRRVPEIRCLEALP
jgi:Fe-S cluster biogenesis protein NfuA